MTTALLGCCQADDELGIQMACNWLIMLAICETSAAHIDHSKCDVELPVRCKRTFTAKFGMLCLEESLLCMLL